MSRVPHILFPSGGSSQDSDSVAGRAEVLPQLIRAIDLLLYISSDDEDEAPEVEVEEGEYIPPHTFL